MIYKAKDIAPKWGAASKDRKTLIDETIRLAKKWNHPASNQYFKTEKGKVVDIRKQC